MFNNVTISGMQIIATLRFHLMQVLSIRGGKITNSLIDIGIENYYLLFITLKTGTDTMKLMWMLLKSQE